MNVLKKIGIAGYGKMGRDIFDSLHTKMPDTDFVILVRHDADSENEKISKNLAKALKRKKISEDNYEKLICNYLFTDDINNFSDCSLIIESISENMAAKQELFSKLDGITDENCVFTTNSSSLKICDIFSVCSDKRKTMGLHFFYPVKLSSYIELNDCADASSAEYIAECTDKKIVSFEGKYCFYLNQFISFCISHAILLSKKYNAGILKCMDILSELFPLHSLFGMADSIGLGLLTSGNTEDNVARIKSVLDYGRSRMTEYMNQGCLPGTGMFLDFIREYEKENDNQEIEKDQFITDMISAMINEAVISASETDRNLTDALFEAVGLSESFGDLYKKTGYEKISVSLNEIRNFSGIDSYSVVDEGIFREILDN